MALISYPNRLRIRLTLALSAAILLTGCAAPHGDRDPFWTSGIVVDTGTYTYEDSVRYRQDTADCRRLAEQTYGAGSGAAGGALAGALFGAAIGVLVGDSGDFALQGAGLGAATGAAAGAGGGVQNRMTVYRNCLRGRGHNVLN